MIIALQCICMFKITGRHKTSVPKSPRSAFECQP